MGNGSVRDGTASRGAPSEGVTNLMVACQQNLEHDVKALLHKKVSIKSVPYFGAVRMPATIVVLLHVCI